MGLDVKVKIDLTKPQGKIGFGIPLLLEESHAEENEIPYTECNSLDAVVTAGFVVTSKVYKAANLAFMQNDTPQKIAVCATKKTATEWLGVSENVEKGWRHLIVVTEAETPTAVSTIITSIEAQEGKMFFHSVSLKDVTSYVKAGIMRTVVFYADPTEDMPIPVAALVGEAAGLTVGSFTYKNLILKGIEPQKLSDAEIEAIHGKGGITFVQKAGDNVTSEGKVLGGEYIDVMDTRDYIIQQLSYKTQKMMNTMPKIPYDNIGIAMLESAAIDVMQDAFNKGMIATTADGAADYTVNYALREASTEDDRAARKYLGGGFKFALAGAIHDTEIVGEITV